MKHIGVIKVFDGTEDVGSTNSVHQGRGTTKMIELNACDVLAFFYTTTNAGAGDCTLKVETMTYYKDDISNAVQSSQVPDISIIAEETDHKALEIPLAPWVSFKVTGIGSNHANTKITLWLVVQEDI